jgi:hypothetical protein
VRIVEREVIFLVMVRVEREKLAGKNFLMGAGVNDSGLGWAGQSQDRNPR